MFAEYVKVEHLICILGLYLNFLCNRLHLRDWYLRLVLMSVVKLCPAQVLIKIFTIGVEKYTQWISRCIATARERIPGSIENYVTGVSECRQQRGNLKDDGYIKSRDCYAQNCIQSC